VGDAITLTDAGKSKGILLDTNVLPHFLSLKNRGIISHFGVKYKDASPRFAAVNARFGGKLYTSVINLVECLGGQNSTAELAKTLLAAFTDVADVRSPDGETVLSLYASQGEAFAEKWGDHWLEASIAVDEVVKFAKTIWTEPEKGEAAIELLQRMVSDWTTWERSWADVYTAQTAIDHGLVVLTEDLDDYKAIAGVQYLVDYDLSRK
jgi:predicted nucleic acid-binding protein